MNCWNSSICKRGFTLLEILLVVAAISILAGIVIVAINPGQQLGDVRNAQRRVDVRTIVNAVNQYRLQAGALPTGISGDFSNCDDDSYEICQTGASSCTGLVNLSVLTTNALYIPSIPIDPSGSTNNPTTGTGYHIVTDSSANRVKVCAPLGEDVTADIEAVQ